MRNHQLGMSSPFFQQVNLNVTSSSYCSVCFARLPLFLFIFISLQNGTAEAHPPSLPPPPFPPLPSLARNRCHDEWKRKLALHNRVNFLPVQKSMSGLAQDPLPPPPEKRFIFTFSVENRSHPSQVVPFYYHVVSVSTVSCHPDRLTRGSKSC